MYASQYLSTVKNAGKEYFYNFMLDLATRKREHIADIREQLERAKGILNGMNYRALDMWKHMDEVLNDEHCIYYCKSADIHRRI